MRSYFWNHSASPAGLDMVDVGRVNVEELDGTTTQFLLNPMVGVLSTDIPAITSVVTLSQNIVASPHLTNIRTSDRETQQFIRVGGTLRELTNPIYEVLPDAFDFFIFFSTDKIERLPRTSSTNFTAGVHLSIQINYTGTGRSLLDGTSNFGGDGKLLGINVLDAYERGTYTGNATHEILHQWVSFTNPSLGLSEGVHYNGRSSVGSLIGGFLWVDNGDGTFTVNCDEGRNGAHYVPPLDKYMMGLIDKSEVSTLHVYTDTVASKCLTGDPVLPAEIATTVTIEDIQSVHGVRTPGPADAQRDFSIAFVVESHERLLNPTEMTFYEILAEHYTKAIPPQDPDPYVGFNWVSIDRFFGEGTTWRSTVISYGADIEPATNTEVADPDTTVTYTLQVTNTGTISDVFDVGVIGCSWPTTPTTTVIGPSLAAWTGATLDVAVSIPLSATRGITDTASIVVTSRGDSTQSVTATLLTATPRFNCSYHSL